MGSEITRSEGYFLAYQFLEYYWFAIEAKRSHKKEDFTLVTIISTMTPGSIEDPDPIDAAKYMDWENALQGLYGDRQRLTSKEVWEGMLAYLRFYEERFGFALSEAMVDMALHFEEKYKPKWKELMHQSIRRMS